MNKPVTLVANDAGGIDLMTERSAGERVLILTGSRDRSVQFWLDTITAGRKALIDLAYTPDPTLAPAGTIIGGEPEPVEFTNPVEPCLLLIIDDECYEYSSLQELVDTQEVDNMLELVGKLQERGGWALYYGERVRPDVSVSWPNSLTGMV